MTEDKALEIFKLALQKTAAGEMHWEQLDASGFDEIYAHSTAGGFSLRAYPHSYYAENDQGEGPPSLTLFDASGKIVFDITSELKGITEEDLNQLYDRARVVALGIDDKLDLILKDLRSTPQGSE